MTFIIPINKAQSVPGLTGIQTSAIEAERVRSGVKMTIILAPPVSWHRGRVWLQSDAPLEPLNPVILYTLVIWFHRIIWEPSYDRLGYYGTRARTYLELRSLITLPTMRKNRSMSAFPFYSWHQHCKRYLLLHTLPLSH